MVTTDLTFEQLEPAFHKWAGFYANKHFEHWELINEVWAMGNVQKLPSINFASRRIKWDMIDYMRQEHKGRIKQRLEAKGEMLPREITFGTQLDGEKSVGDFLGATFDAPEIDTLDYFEWLTKDYSEKHRSIILLRYIDGLDFEEIAKRLGYSNKESVCHAHYSLLKDLRKKLIAGGYQPIQSNRETNTIRDSERQRFYNRQYYARNKERIQLNRRERKRKTG